MQLSNRERADDPLGRFRDGWRLKARHSKTPGHPERCRSRRLSRLLSRGGCIRRGDPGKGRASRARRKIRMQVLPKL
jgi:hypothetical protein